MRFAAASLIVLILISGCSSYESHATSIEPLGRVIHSTGFPSVLRNSRPYILAEHSIVYRGDIIETDEQSLLDLQLDSGATLSLGTHSRLLLGEFQDRKHRLSLSKGSVQVDDISNHKNHFDVATTITSVETYSGKFWIGYDRITRVVYVVSLGEDEVNVHNVDGRIVLTEPFQVTSVTPGAAPKDALMWSEDRFRNTLTQYTRVSR